eukprot:comp14536_c0_seq1/m.21055 comp14536_c0_seq1/g.21055  ORF comp14536_c0_seq1/g.21055 comp14536_c0_seq1/m.21055 type:complete len:325 (+) comp14536_c0_seq1:386-1360(+)
MLVCKQLGIDDRHNKLNQIEEGHIKHNQPEELRARLCEHTGHIALLAEQHRVGQLVGNVQHKHVDDLEQKELDRIVHPEPRPCVVLLPARQKPAEPLPRIVDRKHNNTGQNRRNKPRLANLDPRQIVRAHPGAGHHRNKHNVRHKQIEPPRVDAHMDILADHIVVRARKLLEMHLALAALAVKVLQPQRIHGAVEKPENHRRGRRAEPDRVVLAAVARNKQRNKLALARVVVPVQNVRDPVAQRKARKQNIHHTQILDKVKIQIDARPIHRKHFCTAPKQTHILPHMLILRRNIVRVKRNRRKVRIPILGNPNLHPRRALGRLF